MVPFEDMEVVQRAQAFAFSRIDAVRYQLDRAGPTMSTASMLQLHSELLEASEKLSIATNFLIELVQADVARNG